MSSASFVPPQAHIERERHVLAEITAGIPLRKVLEELLLAVEAQAHHTMRTSVLFLSEDGQHLRHGAAPNLPPAYNDAIDGISVGEGVGCCGTVAFRGEPVYSADINNDPLWVNYRDLAFEHGLHACWSTPIRAIGGSLLGTFAVYYDETRNPTQGDVDAIAQIAQTTAMAIEWHRSDLALLRTQKELRAREIAMRESQERVRIALTAGAIIGTWNWHPSKDLFSIDEGFAKAFGLDPVSSATELPMEEMLINVHPDDKPLLDTAIAEAVLRGGAYVHQYRVRRADGQYHWIEANGRVDLDAMGKPVSFPGVVIDVSERRSLEAERDRATAALRALGDTLDHRVAERTAELEHSRARASVFFNSSQDYLFLVRLSDDQVVYFEDINPACEQVMGVVRADVIGQSIDAFLPHDSASDILKYAKLCLRTGEPLTYDAPRTYRGGRKVIIEGRVACVERFSEGGLCLFSGRDVTEKRQIEEALRQAQKMEAVGQLTGGLAHDFNNLLAGISGSMELMQIRVQQGRFNDVERYMAAAQGATARAAALTHRLLAFSRRQTLEPRPTDVNRLVSGLQEMIQRTVGPGIPVEVVGASGLWPALVDPPQLENALLNLCINARDAMPNGGRITIETANKWLDERASRTLDMPEGQYLSLCVTDTGSGMSPEVIARVFEPFFTTKPIGEGTGLGLSMIYGFAQQSGGQVRIYSELDKGSTVCIYLPRHYGDVSDDICPTNAAALPRSEQGETVLIVDDEPTVRMLLSDILEDLGYTAIEAADSAAGLKVLRSDVRIDLLVTDVGLPGGMNGRQMADAARVTRPNLEVLFITGYAENAILGHGHLAPGMAVLTKPFTIDTMTTRIRTMIEGASRGGSS